MCTNGQAGCMLLASLGVLAERYVHSITMGLNEPCASVPYCVHVTPGTFTALLDLLALCVGVLLPPTQPLSPMAQAKANKLRACFSNEAKTGDASCVCLWSTAGVRGEPAIPTSHNRWPIDVCAWPVTAGTQQRAAVASCYCSWPTRLRLLSCG